MLSSITPMAESARGNRFSVTASWYLAGALLGGLTLGALAAVGAMFLAPLDLSARTQLLVAALAALLATASDGRLFGFQLPGHDRQVNERWLDRYRSWIYGFGFGWQVGFGLTTYIMTAGIYLLVLLGAAGGSPTGALALGAVFGLVRGMAVFATADVRDVASLATFHDRFETWRRPVRQAMVAVLALVAFAAGIASGLPSGVAVATIALIAGVAGWLSRRDVSYRVRLAVPPAR